MSTDEETDRLLRRWFQAGATHAGDRVLDGLGARLGGQPQRAGLVIDWTRPGTRLRTMLLAVGGSTAVLIVALALSIRPDGQLNPAVGPPSGLTTPPGDRPTASADPTLSPYRRGGTYQSKRFAVGVTYTVPDGWWKSGDDPSGFSLSAGEPNHPSTTIELIYDVYPPLVDATDCSHRIDWDRPHGVGDLLDYWDSRSEIVVQEREPVAIGGLDGWRVVLAPKGGCDPVGEVGAEVFVIRNRTQIPTSVGIGFETELIALEALNGRTLVVMVSDSGDDPSGLTEAERVVESFVFGDGP